MDSEQWYEITKQLNDKKYTYIYTNPTQNNNIRLVRKHIAAEDPDIKSKQQWDRIQVREILKIVRDTLNKDKKKKKAENSNKSRRDRKKYYKFISIKMNEGKNKMNKHKQKDASKKNNENEEVNNNNLNNKNNNFTKRIEKTFEKKKKYIHKRMNHIINKINHNLGIESNLTANMKQIKSLAIKKTIKKLSKEKNREEKNDANNNTNNNTEITQNKSISRMAKAIRKNRIIKIASMNPDNASTNENRNIIVEKLENNDIDIACIQETHDTKNTDTSCGNYYIIRSSHNNDDDNNKHGLNEAGVAIYIQKYLKNNITNVIRDNGRYIQMTLQGEHFRNPILLINTYAPNQGYDDESRKQYWKDVCKEFKLNKKMNDDNEKKHSSRIPLIWLTDNNGEIGRTKTDEKEKKCTHAEKNRQQKIEIIGKHTRRKNIEPGNGREFYECLKRNNMIEVTTQQCCGKCNTDNGICKKTATWYHPNGRNNRQIDYIAVTKQQKNWIKNIDKTNFASNTSSRQHRIIIAEIHRNRGKPRNKHDRRAEHIDFDIKELRLNNIKEKLNLMKKK